MTLKQGDLQPKVRALLTDDAGSPIDLTDATGVTFRMINSATDELIIDAAGVIETPVTDGVVTYQWQTGDTDTAGAFRVTWLIVWPDGDQTFPGSGDDTIEIEGNSDLEAWCNAAGARKITGVETSDETAMIAQGHIEIYLNRIWRATDITGRDYVWLRRAVAYQASYVDKNPDLFTGAAGVKMIKQGDNAITYDSTASGDEELLIAPLAKLACARLRRAYGTVKLNSTYRGTDRRLPPWRPAW